MSDVQQLRCAFDSAGATLLLVTPDGGFRLFNTGTGRLQVEFTAHVEEAASAQACTCFCWASAALQKGKKSATKHLLVVGSSAGQVAAYDTALGQRVWHLNDCHQGGVTGLSWAGLGDSSQTVYAVGADATVCSINVASGQLQSRFKAGKHPLTCVQAAAGGTRLLIGSAGLAIWDAASEQRIYKYPGHAMPAHLLAFAANGQYAISGSRAERHVAVWKATGKSSKKAKPAAALLSMTEPPLQLDVATSSSTQFDVLAVSTSGRASVWHCEASDKLTSTLRATIEVERGSETERSTSGRQEKLLTARFQPDSADEVLIARGSPVKPTIETVHLDPVGPAPQSVILHPRQAQGVLLRQPKGKAPGKLQPVTPPAVVGPDNAGEAVMLKPQLAGAAGPAHSRKRQAVESIEEAEAAQPSREPGTLSLETRDADGEQQLTLEQRVNALQIQQQPAQGQPHDAGKLSIKAGSVVVLLSQALRSDDKQLLEKCFSMSSEKVVKATVQQLAPPDAARLLQVAVQRLQASPARGKQIAIWLRAVLLCHTAYLITAPGVQGSLAGLYQAIEARLALNKPLVSLQGRLDLLLAQTPSPDPLASHLTAGPLIYHDESDDIQGEDVEDVMALQAGSDLDSEDEDSESDLDDASDMSDDAGSQ